MNKILLVCFLFITSILNAQEIQIHVEVQRFRHIDEYRFAKDNKESIELLNELVDRAISYSFISNVSSQTFSTNDVDTIGDLIDGGLNKVIGFDKYIFKFKNEEDLLNLVKILPGKPNYSFFGTVITPLLNSIVDYAIETKDVKIMEELLSKDRSGDSSEENSDIFNRVKEAYNKIKK